MIHSNLWEIFRCHIFFTIVWRKIRHTPFSALTGMSHGDSRRLLARRIARRARGFNIVPHPPTGTLRFTVSSQEGLVWTQLEKKEKGEREKEKKKEEEEREEKKGKEVSSLG